MYVKIGRNMDGDALIFINGNNRGADAMAKKCTKGDLEFYLSKCDQLSAEEKVEFIEYHKKWWIKHES